MHLSENVGSVDPVDSAPSIPHPLPLHLQEGPRDSIRSALMGRESPQERDEIFNRAHPVDIALRMGRPLPDWAVRC